MEHSAMEGATPQVEAVDAAPAAASVIYSIYWYRKQLIAMEQKQNGGGKVQQEVEEIKLNLMSLMGDKYQRM